MSKETKKVHIADGAEERQTVEIKKTGRPRPNGREEEMEDGVKELYRSKEFDHLEKPAPSGRGSAWLGVVLAIIFGLISGTVGSLFILTRNTLKIPFFKELDLTQFFPTREISLVTEKNVTVTSDLRLSWLAENSASKMVRIFEAKPIPEKGNLAFLDQIYAPNQVKSMGVIVTSDGWLMSSINFVEKEKYVVVTEDNKILPVLELIEDPLTKISFLKVNAENLPVAKFASPQEITKGRQVVILDKLKRLYFTEVSEPRARDIFKTDDLIRSTEGFSEFLRLDAETGPNMFPDAPVWGLDGTVVGIVSGGKVVPSWQFKNLIPQVLKEKKISRSYLGIDYLNIEEAPGLSSALFKDLSSGAIVYGAPAADSPAGKAGVKNADIIVKADGLALNKDSDLAYLIQTKAPGEETEMTILRSGEEIKIKVKVETLILD